MIKLSGVWLLAVLICCAFTGTGVRITAVLHQPVKSKAVQDFIIASGTYTEERFDDAYYYVFKKKGFDLMMSLGDSVSAVFVYADEADGHVGYRDSLPFGLNVEMSRKDVEKILGKPMMTGGDGVIPFYTGWDNGICITYDRVDTVTLKNPIHHICFTEDIRQ